MTTRFDHLILLVDSTSAWAARFAGAGFTVVDRFDVGGGPDHKLVCFADGGYLELIHVEAGDPHAPAWVARVAPLGEGFGAFSLNVDAVLPVLALLPRGGEAQIIRAGGEVVDVGAWQIDVAAAPQDAGLIVPFVITDIEGTARVPVGDARSHANGATGFRAINLVVDDFSGFSELEPALGPSAEVDPVEWSAGAGRAISIGSQLLTAHRPAAGTRAADHLALRGASVFSVTLEGSGSPHLPAQQDLTPFEIDVLK